MGKADCDICESLGYRSCDVCSGVVFDPVEGRGPYGRGADLCGYCREAMFGGQTVADRASGE